MAKHSVTDIAKHCKSHGGELVKLASGNNYNMRKDDKSANIGRPGTDLKFEDAQLKRGWSATGIPKM